MDIKGLAKYLANNDLPQEEICSILSETISKVVEEQYRKGYCDCLKHINKRKQSRSLRMESDFKRSMDFLSDLTHEN